MTSTDGKRLAESEMQNRQGVEYWFHDCPKAGYPTPGARVATQKPYACNSCGLTESQAQAKADWKGQDGDSLEALFG